MGPTFEGTLPFPERQTGDRIGRVRFDDLEFSKAEALDGQVTVTSALTAQFDLPDLVAEAVSVGLVRPKAVRLKTPVALIDGVPLYRLYTIDSAELIALRRFVDSTVFRMPDGDLTAFLHAVVVARPFLPVIGMMTEAAWVEKAHASTGLTRGQVVGRTLTPVPLVLWTVGVENKERAVRLKSGYRASVDRTPTGQKA